MTRLLLGHAAILYVACLSNKTAINRTVHAAHVHISFDVSQLYTPPTVMDSWCSYEAKQDSKRIGILKCFSCEVTPLLHHDNLHATNHMFTLATSEPCQTDLVPF